MIKIISFSSRKKVFLLFLRSGVSNTVHFRYFANVLSLIWYFLHNSTIPSIRISLVFLFEFSMSSMRIHQIFACVLIFQFDTILGCGLPFGMSIFAKVTKLWYKFLSVLKHSKIWWITSFFLRTCELHWWWYHRLRRRWWHQSERTRSFRVDLKKWTLPLQRIRIQMSR